MIPRILAYSFTLVLAVSPAAVLGETHIVQRAHRTSSLSHESSPFSTTKGAGKGCVDATPEETGFEVYTDEGFLSNASCTELADKCHNWANGSSIEVQKVCPASCFICDPNKKKVVGSGEHPPCYDSSVTGVRFKYGPQASCSDLTNYCNHSTLFHHVQAACRLTCGLCDVHVGHVTGQCHDLESHDVPEFMVGGQLASCNDLVDFCSGHKDAYLIRHKCPRTCGACSDITTSTHSSYQTSSEVSYNSGNHKSDCSRRRRWGFCATRRRRNL